MFNLRNHYQLDKIIITAMDRFVWFVLLIVMSHLVTEYTRVIGSNTNTLTAVNDSHVPADLQVQNLILYPKMDADNKQQQQQQQKVQPSLLASIFGATTNKLQQQQQEVEQQAQQSATYAHTSNILLNMRPVIDSIFEIPISTLRAVNDMLYRLTVGYNSATAPASNTKEAILPHQQTTDVEFRDAKIKMKTQKLMALHEERA